MTREEEIKQAVKMATQLERDSWLNQKTNDHDARIRADERQKVLAEIDGWLDERWKRIFPDEYSVRKVTNTAPFDSRIMGIMHENELFKEHLAQMKEGK